MVKYTVNRNLIRVQGNYANCIKTLILRQSVSHLYWAKILHHIKICDVEHNHGVQRRIISVVNFFVFLRLLFFALLLLYVT